MEAVPVADKLDIVIAQQQQQASQLATIIERTGEHGARLTGLGEAIRGLLDDVSDVRSHTSNCRARTEFARVEREVAEMRKNSTSKSTPKNGIRIDVLGKGGSGLARAAWILGAAIASALATYLGIGGM